MGVRACPEYVVLFRKPPTDTVSGYADEPPRSRKPITPSPCQQIDAHSFWRSSGNRLVAPLMN